MPLNSPGNRVVHSQQMWPMLVVDWCPGWSLARGRSGSPVARMDPTQGVAEKADSRMAMLAQFYRETKQPVEGAVRSAQQHCSLR